MKQYNPIFLLLFLFLCNCANESKTPPPTPNSTKTQTKTTNPATAILIFKKEKKLEIWDNGHKINTQQIDLDVNYPVGVFNINKLDNVIQIKFPNEFYKEKNYSLDFEPSIVVNNGEMDRLVVENMRVYVFPNDARNGQLFEADFSSPHWMSELYAKMNLFLLEFN